MQSWDILRVGRTALVFWIQVSCVVTLRTRVTDSRSFERTYSIQPKRRKWILLLRSVMPQKKWIL